MSAVLFAKAYPLAKRAVSVQSAAFAPSLRAAGLGREDMEQEVLLELFRSLSGFDPQRSALRTFVDRVTSAKAISFIRRVLAEKRRKSAEISIPRTTDTTAAIRVRIEVQRTITLLSSFDTRVAHFLLNGYRPTDIARELKVSRAAVYRAMDRIRDALRERGF